MATMKYCPCCEVEREFKPENRTETYDVRGVKVKVPVAVEVCASCGETLFDEARDQALLTEAYAEYRRSKNLLFPHEIKETRERYALSQKSFAALLGMSEATINRYEQGGLQEETLVGLRRLAAEGLVVAEVHLERLDAHGGARHLDLEPQGDALVGLDADRQHVGFHVAARGGTEEDARDRPEMDRDLGDADG
jgi:putative zinc finger/helix-turn-helix YgiT family protein